MNSIITLLNKSVNINNIESPYVYNNRKVPRVTKILSMITTSNGLMYWANSLGFKGQSYSNVIKKAADIGTQCHDSIDNFLDNDYNYEIPNNTYNDAKNAYGSFLKWWNDISNNGNTIEILYHEFTLTCKYFGGTLDGLYRINGKIYLIDYKTSNHISFKYYLQLAAYRYMIREELGIEIDGCIILQLSKNDISYNEYFVDLSNPEHADYMHQCENTFLSIVYTYYNVFNIENYCKRLKLGE